MNRPLCFVLMPFGKKKDATGLLIDFDAVYHQLIAPAIQEAGLEPIRADEETAGGIIHKPMFERLVLCDFAVADLTTANANVFYELGVRHAIKPYATVLLFYDQGTRLPFDISLLRGLPYKLNHQGVPADITQDKAALVKRLEHAKKAAADQPDTDSPVFQLLDGFPDIQRLKTDVFRERAQYCNEIKKKLALARQQGKEAIREIEMGLGDINAQEAGILIDLMLSYRSVEAYPEMAELIYKMPIPIASTSLVQEQLGFALNRQEKRSEAIQVLNALISRQGPSSETNGILGRVYKDLWEESERKGDEIMAKGYLKKAIEAYLKGFEADWRDAYPGINVVTLMELQEPADARREKILPVVQYAIDQRIAAGTADYWDYASQLELAVLTNDQYLAASALSDALAVIREPFEPKTTARNLRLIREARQSRGEDGIWIQAIEAELNRKGQL